MIIKVSTIHFLRNLKVPVFSAEMPRMKKREYMIRESLGTFIGDRTKKLAIGQRIDTLLFLTNNLIFLFVLILQFHRPLILDL